MSEFIVLGLVPGTHIQISFIVWLLVFGAAGCAYIAFRAYFSQGVRKTLTTAYLIYRLRAKTSRLF